MASDMTLVFELAGFCLAEALLNLSQHYETKLKPGEAALLPSVVIQNPAGKRSFTIFDEVTRETFQKIEGLLEQFTPSDKFAVVTSDGYVTIDGRKFDSVQLNGHLLVSPRQSFCIAVPYVHPDGDRPFGFTRSQIVSDEGFDIDTIDVSGAFVRGRESHKESKRIWDSFFRTKL
jgi:hypothetical protein